MASTSGVFTVTNITLTRSVSTPLSLNTLAHLIGTLIYDVQEGSYDGSDYSFTGNSSDSEYDADQTSIVELFNVAATQVEANTGTTFASSAVTITNREWDVTLNCTQTSATELANVLATFLLYYLSPPPGLEYILPTNKLHYALAGED